MPPDEMSLDSLHADLTMARDALAQLYRVLEHSTAALEKAMHDREALLERVADMSVVADALMAQRDAARAELEALRGD